MEPTEKEKKVHQRRDSQKKQTWIKNVMNKLGFTRERAEAEHKKIFG